MRAYDPAAGEAAAALMPELDVRPDAYEASAGADVVALLTEWEEFRWLDFERVRAAMRAPGDRRRPEPARPGGDAPPGIRVQRNRSSVGSCDSTGTPRSADELEHDERDEPMSRIVVTGGAGFVGSHLCDALLERGDSVVAVDNFSTSRRENVEPSRRPSRFRAGRRRRRARDPGHGPGRRRAAHGQPGQPARVPLDAARDARRQLDRHPARARPRARERRAVPARVDERDLRRSARAPAVGDVPRQRRPDRPARGLRRGEALRRDAHDDVSPALRPPDRGSCASSTPTARACARPTGGSSPTSWCRRSTGEPLTVYGNGTQTRSFCFVADEVRGILALFDSRDRRAGQHREPDRVHDARAGRSSSARSRAPSPSFVYESLPMGDPTRRKPDITRAQQLLGWEPKVELREGLERTHAWYLEERARGRA